MGELPTPKYVQTSLTDKWKNCIASYHSSCFLKPPKRNGLNHFIFQPKFPVFPSKINGKYCKILKMSPGAYIFQRPFLRGLFSEGLIFEGAYIQREIGISKLIGLVVKLEVNLEFLLSFTLYLRAIFQVQAPGELIFGGGFNRGFFVLPVWGAYIWRGLHMEGFIFGILRYP